jgi:SAM-dependent methyltransferase
MPHTTTTAGPNFDRVARIYRWAEYLCLGTALRRTREHFLPQLEGRRHAVALGDGDGRFLARLLRQQPHLDAVAVDTSAAMLQLLQQRCLRTAPDAAGRLRTVQVSALDLPPQPEADLIVTHFFLDCLTQNEVETLARKLSGEVAPGTLWLLSDFGEPRPRALRPLAALYIRSLYLAFRVLTGLRTSTLPDPQTALRSAGFERIARAERLFGLLYTELWRRR